MMSDERATSGQPIERRLAGVLLVDGRGWLLLQLRDASAPVSPNSWSMPGGGIEPGEEPEEAARRELVEETGLRVAGELALFWEGLRPSGHLPGALVEWHVYSASTSARQEDVILGEGAAMEFVAPERVPTLTLAESAQFFLPRFLASDEYRRLAGGAV